MAQIVFTFFLYAIGIAIMGLALYPAVLFFAWIWAKVGFEPLRVRCLWMSFAGVSAYFIFGFSLILLVGLFRFVFRLSLKEGEYPALSIGSARWALVNSLQLLISITFMDFIMLTPFANLFFRLMGAKLGRNVQINSKYCADLSLLEVGDNSVIGGHSTVICHSFERKRFILKKVKIGRNVVIGLNSVILPGAEIGDGSMIAAGAVLGKNTKAEPRSVYFGVPAESVKERRTREGAKE